MPLPYTPALAHAELRRLNAARSGCPLAQFAADNARARALNAAYQVADAAREAADPEAYHHARTHDEALAADQYYNLEA